MFSVFAYLKRHLVCAGLAGLLVLLSILMGVVYVWLLADLPEPGMLTRSEALETTKFYDRQGRLLYEWMEPLEGRHTYVPLPAIPPYLRAATIAVEDVSFYQNPGVDLRAILRSIYLNICYRRIVSGASTITQQVARLLLLSPQERWQRTWTRKLREAFLAWRIARTHSKDKILELYLNHSYYGHLAYGVEAAARAYFGKRVDELDLAECALLAGLPQSPVAYDPLTDPDAARKRQATVLSLMVRAGYINEKEAMAAREEELRFAATPFPIEAPHFVMYVRQLLEAQYGLEAVALGGWRVYTSLDLEAQRCAEGIVKRHLAVLNDFARDNIDHNVRNAALVALDPDTGEILAMVGSPDYFEARIDGAVNAALAPRQPGSSIKPITYALALTKGYTPATIIYDVRRAFLTAEGDPYVPVNYDRRYHGPLSLRQALATSSNVAAVSVLNDVRVPAMLNLARSLGLTFVGDPERFGLALTLGGGEVRLLDLTAAYACFAAGGQRVEASVIQRIEDSQGRVLYEHVAQARKQVIAPEVAYLITDILSDDGARLSAFGERSALYIGRPAAAKTGTTTDWRDNWTIGYTPDLVTGVWVGNADNEPMEQVSGITGAAPIWHDFMVELLKGKPAASFREPPNIVQVEICPQSGLLPNPYCPHRRYEKFVAGTEPTQSCQVHRLYRLDAVTGLPATPETPASRIIERVYYLLPPEAAEWGREQGIEQPSVAASFISQVSPRNLVGPLTITSPDPNARYVISRELPLSVQCIEIAVRWDGSISLRQLLLALDREPLAVFDRPPYRTLWPLAPGTHVVTAEAIDEQGHHWTSAPLQFVVEPAS